MDEQKNVHDTIAPTPNNGISHDGDDNNQEHEHEKHVDEEKKKNNTPGLKPEEYKSNIESEADIKDKRAEKDISKVTAE